MKAIDQGFTGYTSSFGIPELRKAIAKNASSKGVDVTVTALNEDAWMATSIPYWEGPVTVTGSHQGIGYLEMTGYD